MPVAMTKIAQLLLDSPTAPLHLSITELARQAGTSPATVTRFCRLIGYSGYVPFRVGVASDIGRGDALESWRADVGRVLRVRRTPRTTCFGRCSPRRPRRCRPRPTGSTSSRCGRVARAIATCAASRHLRHRRQRRDGRGDGASGCTGSASTCTPGPRRTPASPAPRCSGRAASRSASRTPAAPRRPSRCWPRPARPARSRWPSPARPPRRWPRSADVHITAYATDAYLQPDDLAAKHAQLFILDLLYLLVAQQDFSQVATHLAASAMAVSGHRRASTVREPAITESGPATRTRTRRTRARRPGTGPDPTTPPTDSKKPPQDSMTRPSLPTNPRTPNRCT